jgi:hypothetical protein
VLEQGAERFGPVPAEVEAAIQAETRPEVWAGWLPRWKEIRDWHELIPGLSRGRQPRPGQRAVRRQSSRSRGGSRGGPPGAAAGAQKSELRL